MQVMDMLVCMGARWTGLDWLLIVLIVKVR